MGTESGEVDLLQRAWKRYDELAQREGLSRLEYDRQKETLAKIRKRLRAVQAQKEELQAALVGGDLEALVRLDAAAGSSAVQEQDSSGAARASGPAEDSVTAAFRRDGEELRARDIAERLGISIAGARTRLRRAHDAGQVRRVRHGVYARASPTDDASVPARVSPYEALGIDPEVLRPVGLRSGPPETEPTERDKDENAQEPTK